MKKITCAFALLLSLTLSGCLESNEPPPSIYRLGMGAGQHQHAQNARIVLMAEPEVPAGFDTDRIALYLSGGRQIDYYAGSQWPDRLPKVLGDALEQAAGDVDGMRVVTSDSGLAYTYILSVRVKDFEPVYASTAKSSPKLKVVLDFRLVARNSQKIVLETTQRAEGSASGNTRSAIVSGLEKLLKSAAVQGFKKVSVAIQQRAEEDQQDDEKDDEKKALSGKS